MWYSHMTNPSGETCRPRSISGPSNQRGGRSKRPLNGAISNNPRRRDYHSFLSLEIALLIADLSYPPRRRPCFCTRRFWGLLVFWLDRCGAAPVCGCFRFYEALRCRGGVILRLRPSIAACILKALWRHFSKIFL